MRYEYQDRVALSALIHCNFRRSSSMKTRLIAIIVAMLAFYGVVSAQGYHIRTTFHTNLRDTYSLSGGIVATVPPGAVLHVVGNVNRWLKINRNGNEAWMADWVGYTRVESSDQTGTQQQTSLIDNCCFVDRQCSTNKQWTDGYWAFQNGQCTAPAQSQEQTSTPATGSVPANIDNCCYVNRQCSTDQQWTDGYFAYQAGQCSAPTQSQVSVQPTTGSPVQIDNCCLVGWHCQTDQEWTNGYFAYQNNLCDSSAQSAASISPNQSLPALPVTRSTVRLSSFKFDNCCYMDPDAWRCTSAADWNRGYAEYQNHQCLHPLPIGTRPATEGNPKFHRLVDDALALIRTHAPEWLNYIYSSGAHKFELRQPGERGGFYNAEWSISHSWTAYERDDPAWAPDFHYLVGYAGGITHEACHAMQQRTHTHMLEAWRDEKECTEAQLAVIEAIDPTYGDIGWLRDTVANIENPDYWWW